MTGSIEYEEFLAASELKDTGDAGAERAVRATQAKMREQQAVSPQVYR